MTFSDRLDFLLLQQKITKTELAKFAGITTQTFYDWKKRGSMPAADVAVKIAQYLNTSVEFLITGKELNSAADELAEIKQKIKDFADSL